MENKTVYIFPLLSILCLSFSSLREFSQTAIAEIQARISRHAIGSPNSHVIFSFVMYIVQKCQFILFKIAAAKTCWSCQQMTTELKTIANAC